ncbi:hypothetical protein NM688_g1535 [Phlebia brevispora]|uniref:Uncharacterized protein n=1 Tax=Phlebia brevispora TaxID=194682 RepID=A0ACC1TBI4_9APHY|nr:hypothetical protein NM688_g1535 [Phlebia brevispora]
MEDTSPPSSESLCFRKDLLSLHTQHGGQDVSKRKINDTSNTLKEDGDTSRAIKGSLNKDLWELTVSNDAPSKASALPAPLLSSLLNPSQETRTQNNCRSNTGPTSKGPRRSAPDSKDRKKPPSSEHLSHLVAASGDSTSDRSDKIPKLDTSSTTMPPPAAVTENDMTADTPDHEDLSDDAVSIAESSKATRKRKSEKERIDWFLDDDDCEVLEPYRIQCARCKNWIDLHPKRKYVMKPWIVHKKTCEAARVEELPPEQVSGMLSENVAPENLESTTHITEANVKNEENIPSETANPLPSNETKPLAQDEPDLRNDVAEKAPQTPRADSRSRSPKPELSPPSTKKRGIEDVDDDDDDVKDETLRSSDVHASSSPDMPKNLDDIHSSYSAQRGSRLTSRRASLPSCSSPAVDIPHEPVE